MEARYVRPVRGLQWIVSGAYFFREAPLNLMLLCFTYLLVGATLGLVPVLGGFIGTLTLPVFIAGIMVALRGLDINHKLELETLFIGFRQNTVPLITVGGIYLLGDVLIVGLFMLLGGDALVDMLMHGKRFQENELAAVMDDALSAVLFSLLLAIPLMMAVWFAPMLVMFEKIPPVLAMRISFFACLKNLFAFQLYAIALIALAVLAAMPYGLGFILWFPIAFASVYVSYKDIFHYEDEIEPQPQSQPESETTSLQNEDDKNG